WIQQNLPTKNDAAIGITFTFMFALGVTGISLLSRKEGVHLDLNDFLFGNILGISQEDLWLNAIILLAILFSMIVFYRFFYLTTFQEKFAKTIGINTSLVHYYLMLLLAFTVVASLQSVGVILVVAMLISPASAALLWSDSLKKTMVLSSFLGAFSALSGLVFAIIFELPPGPAMAICAFGIYLFSAFFAPQKGVIANYFEKRYYQNKIIAEDILKLLFKVGTSNTLSHEDISKRLGINTQRLKPVLQKMTAKKFITPADISPAYFQLTKKGKETGELMVRAHRLWESWLVNQTGLKDDQIHQDAEIYEHLLDKELIDHLDASLNFPEKDPHGQKIPRLFSIEKIRPEEIKSGDEIFIHQTNGQEHLFKEHQFPLHLFNYRLLVVAPKKNEIEVKKVNEKKSYCLKIEREAIISRIVK
ncbi:MAG: hypothetical protein EA362_13940, partial [Saprospirales bacterium]